MDRKKWASLSVCVLMTLTMSQVWVFENQQPYLASYLACVNVGFALCGDSADTSQARVREQMADGYSRALRQTAWALTVMVVAEGIGMALGPMLKDRLNSPRMALAIGGVVMAVGQSLACFTLRRFALFVLFYGFCQGLGLGICFMQTVAVTGAWFPHWQWPMLLVVVAFIVSPFIWDPIQTDYVNCGNDSFDEDLGFMTSEGVLKRTPLMLLYTAIAFAAIQCIGVLFMWSPSAPQSTDSTLLRADDSQSQSGEPKTLKARERLSDDSIGTYEHSVAIIRCDESGSDSLLLKDLTLSEAIRTLQFWQLAVISISNMITLYWMAATWKVFGNKKVGIHSDSFLSRVGMLTAVSGAIGRTFWSLLYDWPSVGQSIRYTFGLKQLVFTVGLILSPFVAAIANALNASRKVVFAADMCIAFSGVGGVYVFLPSIVRRTFGKTHCDRICGVLFFTESVGMVMVSWLFAAIPERVSWFKAQLIVSLTAIVAFIFIWFYKCKLETRIRTLETYDSLF